jgi:phasin family protein
MYEPKNLAEMFTPKFDVTALAAVQRRNLDTFSAVGARIAAGAQAFLKRQSEIVQVHINDQLTAAQEVMSTTDAQTGLQKQLSFAQSQAKKALADTQELASIMQSTATETFDILRQSAEAGVAEMNGNGAPRN